MSDNKNLRDGRDDSKVDKNDPSEVEQVHSRVAQSLFKNILRVHAR
jgi:hypothetical protein